MAECKKITLQMADGKILETANPQTADEWYGKLLLADKIVIGTYRQAKERQADFYQKDLK